MTRVELPESGRDRSQSSARNLQRRNTFARWALFGVLLPLLPIMARVSASWVDIGHPTTDYRTLFGDGDLLVLAVVVAAAGIGDLLFSVRRHVTVGPREAVAISLALFVVVLSGVAYGLVTLKQESRGSLQQSRVTETQVLQEQLRLAQSNLDAAVNQVAEAQRTRDLAVAAANAEVDGSVTDGGSGVRGVGALAEEKMARASQAQQALNASMAAQKRAQVQLDAAANSLNGSISQVAHSDSTNTSQTATISLTLFFASVMAVTWCILVGTSRNHELLRDQSPSI